MVPPWASSKRPTRRSSAPGEGALRVAEELALEQRGRQGRAVGLDEQVVAARAQVVDAARQVVLAGAGLARDQHGGVGVGRLPDGPHDLGHGRGGVEKLVARVFLAALQQERLLALEIPVHVLEPGVGEHVVHGDGHLARDFRQDLGQLRNVLRGVAEGKVDRAQDAVAHQHRERHGGRETGCNHGPDRRQVLVPSQVVDDRGLTGLNHHPRNRAVGERAAVAGQHPAGLHPVGRGEIADRIGARRRRG